MRFFDRFARGRDQATPARALGSVAAVITTVVVVIVIAIYVIQSQL